MNKLKTILLAAIMVTFVGSVPLVATTDAGALSCTGGIDCASQGSGATGQSKVKGGLGGVLKAIVNILLYVLGAIAVIMIVIGGIRYTTSNGDQGQLTSAKNTILYAVVGLVIAVMAYAIVNFVLSALK